MAEVADARLAHVRCAAEHVRHRHNVSALLRTCDALGVHRVHLAGDVPFVASRGACLGADHWLDIAHHDTVEEAVARLRADGVALWVADLDERGVPPEAVPLDRPVCLWFGAEVLGVHPVARRAADGVVTLPMRGMAQSLNVSVAGALVLHTVAERTRAHLGDAARLPVADREALLAGWIARDTQDLGEEAARQEALHALGVLADEDAQRG